MDQSPKRQRGRLRKNSYACAARRPHSLTLRALKTAPPSGEQVCCVSNKAWGSLRQQKPQSRVRRDGSEPEASARTTAQKLIRMSRAQATLAHASGLTHRVREKPLSEKKTPLPARRRQRGGGEKARECAAARRCSARSNITIQPRSTPPNNLSDGDWKFNCFRDAGRASHQDLPGATN